MSNEPFLSCTGRGRAAKGCADGQMDREGSMAQGHGAGQLRSQSGGSKMGHDGTGGAFHFSFWEGFIHSPQQQQEKNHRILSRLLWRTVPPAWTSLPSGV